MTDLTSAATTLGRDVAEKARAFADTNPVAKKAKDAVFTAVGFGVLGTQKAAAAAKSVQSTVDTDGVSASVKKSVADVTTTVKRQAAWVDEQLNKTVKTIDEAVAPFEEKLPSAVRDVAAKARSFGAKFVNRESDLAHGDATTTTKTTSTKSTKK